MEGHCRLESLHQCHFLPVIDFTPLTSFPPLHRRGEKELDAIRSDGGADSAIGTALAAAGGSTGL